MKCPVSIFLVDCACLCMRQLRFWMAPGSFLSNEGISSLIGSGNPSCMSITGEWNTTLLNGRETYRELLGFRIPRSSTQFCPLSVQLSNLTYSTLNNWIFSLSLTFDSQCSSGMFLRTAYPRASVANFTLPRWSTLAIIANSCCIRSEE